MMETQVVSDRPTPAAIGDVKHGPVGHAVRDVSRAQRKADRDEHRLRREARVRAETVRWG